LILSLLTYQKQLYSYWFGLEQREISEHHGTDAEGIFFHDEGF
jgi:hypothetical protein